MLLDFVNRTTAYFIDDHFLGAISTAGSVSNVLLRGAMVVYARPDNEPASGPTSLRANYSARFDNFRISTHSAAPEIH